VHLIFGCKTIEHITSCQLCPKRKQNYRLKKTQWKEVFLQNTKEAVKLGQTAVPTQQNKELLVNLELLD
jgi:hypothetical protein